MISTPSITLGPSILPLIFKEGDTKKEGNTKKEGEKPDKKRGKKPGKKRSKKGQ